MMDKKILFYKKNGFLKIKLFNKKEINLFKKIIASDLKRKFLNKFKRKLNFEKLENYHKLKISENEHKYVVNPSHRYFAFNKKIVKKISSLNE